MRFHSQFNIAPRLPQLGTACVNVGMRTPARQQRGGVVNASQEGAEQRRRGCYKVRYGITAMPVHARHGGASRPHARLRIAGSAAHWRHSRFAERRHAYRSSHARHGSKAYARTSRNTRTASHVRGFADNVRTAKHGRQHHMRTEGGYIGMHSQARCGYAPCTEKFIHSTCHDQASRACMGREFMFSAWAGPGCRSVTSVDDRRGDSHGRLLHA